MTVKDQDKTKAQLIDELAQARRRITELEGEKSVSNGYSIALEDANEKYRRLFENASDSIFIVDPVTFCFLDFNANAARRLGYTRKELLALTLDDIQRIATDTLKGITVWRSETSDSTVYECIHRRKDGTEMWVEVSTRFIHYDGQRVMQLFARNITERKQAQQEQKRMGALLRATLESIVDGLVVIDCDGNLVIFNQRYAELWHYPTNWTTLSAEERLDLTARQTKDPSAFLRRIDALSGDARYTGTEIVELADGRIFERFTQPYYLENLYMGRLYTYRDITERKRAETEREQLIDELDAFTHTVAHDLKNPLAGLIGYVTMLRDDIDELPQEAAHGFLREAQRIGYKVYSIIDELLLLSSIHKLDDVQTADMLRPLDMEFIISGVQQRLTYMLEEHKAEIIPPNFESWPVAKGYAPWVEEVWTNYISNAIKYGGTEAEVPRVELGAELLEDGETVRFWVHDNGPGLAPEDQAKLFREYVRLKDTRARGHGLGLSIVKRIVERLDGTTGVESAEGAGSTFYFTLPKADE